MSQVNLYQGPSHCLSAAVRGWRRPITQPSVFTRHERVEPAPTGLPDRETTIRALIAWAQNLATSRVPRICVRARSSCRSLLWDGADPEKTLDCKRTPQIFLLGFKYGIVQSHGIR